MDSVRTNDTRSFRAINYASNQQCSNQSNAEFGYFNKPGFSEATKNPRVSLTVNRSKLDIPFKSELCMLFQRGKCYYGDNCHYAHSMSDISNPSFRGLANGYQRNKMNKWKKCFRFSSGRGCPYGDKCQFLHERVSEYRESSALSIVNGAGRIECKSLNAGQVYRQVYQRQSLCKMKLCNKWEKFGRCPHGLNCIYAHGQAELRSVAELESSNTSNAKAVAMQSGDSEHKTACELRLRGKRCFMKWNVEKISRIYADWIES